MTYVVVAVIGGVIMVIHMSTRRSGVAGPSVVAGAVSCTWALSGVWVRRLTVGRVSAYWWNS